uniref:TIGR02453 family protein n=1 Tax=Yoonia sp. TaxID=2212373 RepID=UPI004047D1F2
MSNALISTAQTFYAALSDNNTKEWWAQNRSTYDDHLKPAALALLDDIAPKLAHIADSPVTCKLFRPHRDVRFPKDKTPYKTHLHMMWTLDVPARQAPVFFFGIGTDYVTAGAGLMGFDKPVLEDWRKFVDLDTPRISRIIGAVEAKGFALRDPALKRVPSAYPADHPAARLLRMKGCVASKDIGTPTDMSRTLLDAFKDLAPLVALLLQIAEA